tara:strand:+ start:817 stop:984 length:168 start_codon:yes stop_codon:yes gene_type:complete
MKNKPTITQAEFDKKVSELTAKADLTGLPEQDKSMAMAMIIKMTITKLGKDYDIK